MFRLSTKLQAGLVAPLPGVAPVIARDRVSVCRP